MNNQSQSNRPFITRGILKIDSQLCEFLEKQVMPKVGIDADDYWQKFAQVVIDFTPRNLALLAKRDDMQQQIDQWHKEHLAKNGNLDYVAYKQFLQEIGYLLPEGEDFSVSTQQVDDEIANIAGPQLVVPVRNARYALNAANARWGSLYDALYGTDVIDENDGKQKTANYNPQRGKAVVAYAKGFLDEHFTLQIGSYDKVTSFVVVNDDLNHDDIKNNGTNKSKLIIYQGDNRTQLKDASQFVGYQGDKNAPTAILLKHHHLHVEIQIDADHAIGQDDPAHIKDVWLESAVTAIQDMEDSVAAVDAEEKLQVYQNWFGLMQGDLTDTFQKGDKQITRQLNPDREYTAPDGSQLVLAGRALLLVRNVGHLMQNPAILVDMSGHGGQQNEEIFEGIMDTLITALLSVNDIKGNNALSNSRKGSLYIVKPKMHGAEEVKFANDLFAAAEDVLNLPRNTIKMGIMDEERRTTVNLKEAIRQAKERVIFINTGFLDRTGDEIHTSMQAGAFVRKGDMKSQAWLTAYEQWNVDIGLATGLLGKAQIGKGMWAKPDEMKQMLASKIAHPQAGATTAWVPSPTGATLHSIHYHQVDVSQVQRQLKNRKRASIDDILTIPLATDTNWSKQDIQNELDNNAQGILGYVVRWVDQGVGCSKVPDINNVGLMEDRATLRISSQHMANWLYHGVVSEDDIMAALKRMAKVVDEQNADDPNYQPMTNHYETSYAFQAAKNLILKGREQPNGYTEPLLHQARLALKAGD